MARRRSPWLSHSSALTIVTLEQIRRNVITAVRLMPSVSYGFGQSALEGVSGGVFDLRVAERNCMLDVYIRKDLHLRTCAARRLQHQRDQMRFGIVPLAKLLRCARRVEIAQARVTQAEITLALRQRLFKRQFRFAIRVCRLSRITLFDRLLFGLAINGRS